MSLENVKNVILILSGKGGVGKSSITTQLALSLSLAGKSVGILDIDLTGPSIPRFLGLEDAKIKQAPGGWLPVEVHKSQTLPPIPTTTPPTERKNGSTTSQADGSASTQDTSPPPPSHSTLNTPPTPIGALHAISLAFLLPTRSSAVIWRGPKKTAMVRQFLTDVLWPPSGIDYLLIDTPPGTSDEHIALAETLLQITTTTTTHPSATNADPSAKRQPRLAGAVIVTTPQAVAIADVRKELNFCRKTGIGVIGVVENMVGFVCECCGEESNLFGGGGGERMAGEFGVRFLGAVALDAAWGRLVEEGRRPRYGDADGAGAGVGDEGNGEVDGGREQEEENRGGKGREEGLLVDKYRSCRLWETMGKIAGSVIGIVEENGEGDA